jgi:hypothetical protein
MNKAAEWFWISLGACLTWGLFALGPAIFLIPLLAWRAFAAVTLWKWFIAPVWPDLWPHPSIYAAGGILFVVNVFMPVQQVAKETNKYSWTVPFFYPAFILAAGWVWKWWFT